jgi:hypothetical protein
MSPARPLGLFTLDAGDRDLDRNSDSFEKDLGEC